MKLSHLVLAGALALGTVRGHSQEIELPPRVLPKINYDRYNPRREVPTNLYKTRREIEDGVATSSDISKMELPKREIRSNYTLPPRGTNYSKPRPIPIYTRNVMLPLEVRVDSNAAEIAQITQSILERIPDSIQERLNQKGLRVIVTDEWEKISELEVLKDKSFLNRVAGLACYGTNSWEGQPSAFEGPTAMIKYDCPTEFYIDYATLHEVGHIVDSVLGHDMCNKALSSTFAFKDAYREDYQEIAHLDSHFHSEFEFFPAAFRMFYNSEASKKELQTSFRHTYGFMEYLDKKLREEQSRIATGK